MTDSGLVGCSLGSRPSPRALETADGLGSSPSTGRRPSEPPGSGAPEADLEAAGCAARGRDAEVEAVREGESGWSGRVGISESVRWQWG